MTAHVSYLGLFKAQAKPVLPLEVVDNAPLTGQEVISRIKAVRASLGAATKPGSVPPAMVGRKVPKAPAVDPPKPVLAVAAEEPGEFYGPFLRIPPAPWEIILREVSDKHGISIIDIKSDRRSVPLVRARHEAMYRMSKETLLSYPQIGRRLGGKDHTTVLHGARRHRERMEAGKA